MPGAQDQHQRLDLGSALAVAATGSRRLEEVRRAIEAINARTDKPELARHLGRIWAIRAARTHGVGGLYVRAAVALVVLKSKFSQQMNTTTMIRLLRRIEARRAR